MEPPIKNENAVAGDFEQRDLLTNSQVQDLSDHLFSLFQVSENGALRKMDSSNPPDPAKNDTRRAYFSKAKIDALFNANPGSDGIYIYFGAFSPNINLGNRAYNNKLTCMMVTAKGTTINLLDAASVSGATGAGMALTPIKTCPPDICP
ncbi:hypothetical protein [Mucilaginibacter sp. BT774]|uniref:hypothetical protein n=1 Tax=Mucilaginibacter sp. BT774 TaxID=3062276 RepID=UPI0026754D88|nr:hypothetical protein [Mucilaginibacter sp. BT774]MDO3627945.1 hypothetical protein [Mucilaginibacter sp. BT774]